MAINRILWACPSPADHSTLNPSIPRLTIDPELAAGGIAAQVASLSDYAATFYQNLSTQSNIITANQTTQDDRLTEAKSRVSSNSGVNLDEELTSLTSFQQAYAAGARILTVVDQLYQTLLQIQ